MNVREYAESVNLSVAEILKKCESLGIDVSGSDSYLSDDDVINLEPFSIDWIDSIDVIVDGRYVQKVREEDIHSGTPALWRGSSNQNVIDVKKSLSAGRIVSFL